MDENLKMPVRIRPHHLEKLIEQSESFFFLRIHVLLEKQKDMTEPEREFWENFRDVLRQIFPEDSKIEIVKGLDDFCSKCPDQERCAKDVTIDKSDNSYIKRYGLGYGIYLKREIKKILRLNKGYERWWRRVRARISWKLPRCFALPSFSTL